MRVELLRGRGVVVEECFGEEREVARVGSFGEEGEGLDGFVGAVGGLVGEERGGMAVVHRVGGFN